MATADDHPETPKHPNSRRDLEQRRADRLAGKLNPLLKSSVHGLADIVAAMSGRVKHSLYCQCDTCIPPEVRAWMVERGIDRPFVPFEPEPEHPKVKIKGKKGFPKPRKKWTERRGNSSN